MKKHIKLFEEFTSMNEGTGNFLNNNASKIFAIGEGDDEDEAQMNYEDGKMNVETALEAVGYDLDGKTSEPNSNRNFEGTIIADKSESVTPEKDETGSVSADIRMYSILRNGYYQGGNFDWSYKVMIGNSEYEDEIPDEDVIEDDVVYLQDKEDKDENSKEVAEELHKLIEAKKDAMVEEIEKVYGENTMKLKVTARFSSGETHYGKVE